jgi:hypothetical protein
MRAKTQWHHAACGSPLSENSLLQFWLQDVEEVQDLHEWVVNIRKNCTGNSGWQHDSMKSYRKQQVILPKARTRQ